MSSIAALIIKSGGRSSFGRIRGGLGQPSRVRSALLEIGAPRRSLAYNFIKRARGISVFSSMVGRSDMFIRRSAVDDQRISASHESIENVKCNLLLAVPFH